MKDGLTSPIIQKYQKTLAESPDSRVFAPLAESYRRLGLFDRAFEVLKEGVRRNPDYVLGYLVLASCYADKDEHQLVYTTLRPLVHNNRDNLRLQKLFAQSCLKLKHIDEALETYKYLLFMNPKDSEIAGKVKELDNVSPVHETTYVEETDEAEHFDVDKLKVTPDENLDSWVQKDFSNTQQDKKDDLEDWEVKKPDEDVVRDDDIELHDADEDEREFKIELVDEEPRDIIEKELEDGPVITHTLVDLYCAQGHFSKAIEILEKILVLNPNDKLTQKKLEEVKEVYGPGNNYVEDNIDDDIEEEIKVTEDEIELNSNEREIEVAMEKNMAKETFLSDTEGRDDLMKYFDAKVAEHNELYPEEEEEIEAEEELHLEEKIPQKVEVVSVAPGQEYAQIGEKRDRLMAFLGAVKIRAKQARELKS